MTESYLDYLKKRSLLGYLYRTYFLYPSLSKYLDGRTLDVGCGIGDFLKYSPNTEGVDVNPDLVNYCKSQNLNAQIMEFDVLPYSSNSFDSIVLDNVLEHLENPSPLLAEIERVLVKGGILIVGVPGSKGYKKDSDHKHFYDDLQLVDIIKKYNFEKIDIFGRPLNLPFLSSILSSYCFYGIFRKC